MKGYKAFNKGWVCRDFQYELGQTYELPDGQEPIMCKRGFHFCENPIDVFGYYPMNDDTLIAEVEALGSVLREGTKLCTNKIRIVKEFTRKQLQALLLDGNFNSGNYNSGDYNSGDYNSGNCNSGNCNSGNCNSGNYNSGNCNSGDYNSGNCNSGNFNSGNYNSGNCNSGNYNSGNCNSGNYNSGIFNSNEPKMRAFNKLSKLTYKQFLNSLDYSFYGLCSRIAAKSLGADDWDKIRALPNYDAEVFAEITGLRENDGRD